MRLILLVVFIAFPLLELAILIKLGSIFGFWPTFALVVITAIVGTTVLHHQGFGVMRRMQDAVADGQPPIEPVVDGVLLLASGLLLITPGLITDTIGLVLLIPPFRRFLARSAFRRWFGSILEPEVRGTRRTSPSDRPENGGSRAGPGPVIDADYERLD